MIGLFKRNNNSLTLKAKIYSVTLLALVLPLEATGNTTIAAPEPATGWQGKAEVAASQYMAVTANPIATQTAVDVLANGGNAIDAMVAAQLVLNLVEPQSSGIGGGAFLVYWDANKRLLQTFDGRETAPALADENYFRKPSGDLLKWRQARIGGRAVGVPGTLDLLHTAHTQFGDHDWAKLFRPAIGLAREGFSVSPRLSRSITGASKYLKTFPETAEYFFTPAAEPLPAGYVLKNPAFAKTLSLIANKGPGVFYDGPIGKGILESLGNTSELPSLMTEDDLRAYQTISRPAVCAPFKGFSICGMGPPSSGGLTVGQILGISEHFNLQGTRPTPHGIHIVLEASRLAFADRARFMADSDFVPVPVAGLINPGYLKRRAGLVEAKTAMGKAKAGNPPGADLSQATFYHPESVGTSHLSIVDQHGNIVSLTTTIESGFGSTIMTQGFLLNNEMTDFSFRKSVENRPIANRVEGSKRPRSSMAPTIVFNSDGRPVLVAGSPGGSRIICYVAKTIVSILEWGMGPQEAVSTPHFCNRNGKTELESQTPETTQSALVSTGHDINIKEMNSGLHVIQILSDGRLIGGADPRREGLAMGD
ncbi:MAG: gamma-glutamyltransferase [Proteobacteria bacterium]|nr:gamma-glutamyltransferase [Pseudomonadota bacterium]